ELHRERRKELAAIIVREMGKPFAAAVGEVDFSADITEYYANQTDVITADQPLTILGEGTAVIRRSPLGVLFGIMPWNFPYYQVARFAAPNAARLDNTGQSCNAAKRFIVMDGLYDEFLAKFATVMAASPLGDPMARGTVLGPLSSLEAATRLQGQVDRAVAQGATVVTG